MSDVHTSQHVKFRVPCKLQSQWQVTCLFLYDIRYYKSSLIPKKQRILFILKLRIRKKFQDPGLA